VPPVAAPIPNPLKVRLQDYFLFNVQAVEEFKRRFAICCREFYLRYTDSDGVLWAACYGALPRNASAKVSGDVVTISGRPTCLHENARP
jgi:hypothetical protein